MSIKKLINEIIISNYLLSEKVKELKKDFKPENTDNYATKLIKLIEENKFYSEFLSYKLSIALQITNDKKLIEQYELEEIKKLLESNIELNPYFVENYIELANFEFAVINNNDKAKVIAQEGLKIAKNQIKELKKVLKKIQEDENL